MDINKKCIFLIILSEHFLKGKNQHNYFQKDNNLEHNQYKLLTICTMSNVLGMMCKLLMLYSHHLVKFEHLKLENHLLGNHQFC